MGKVLAFGWAKYWYQDVKYLKSDGQFFAGNAAGKFIKVFEKIKSNGQFSRHTIALPKFKKNSLESLFKI